MRWFLMAVICVTSVASAQQKTRDEKVRDDREKVMAEGFWIYNDLPTAFRQATETGKPLLVVLRCIPCEECVKLDDELVDADPVIRPLLEKFVCVRVVSTNGLDLNLFQYDTDQSFAVFMLNADRTIYGRFGTRSHRTEWLGDVSLKGLAEALQGALELHANYPANRALLAGKTGPKPLFDSPEKFPKLRERYTSAIDYSGAVAKSCIHCHQIGDSIRDYYRDRGEPIPETVLHPYPHPRSIGLVLDPTRRAVVQSVTPNTPAAAAGLHAGDSLLTLNGQPLISMADVQWVLQSVAPTGGQVHAVVDRDGSQQNITIQLQDGWRHKDDFTWRVSTWGLRRMGAGGLKMKPADEET
ncbi:MAG: thioredoxin family protein, partial [Planctomycetaceae bacterium]|nr:thioredoxin family protein [Planctomycetaceae bacterium]